MNGVEEFNISRFLLFLKQVGEHYEAYFAKAATQCELSKPEADVLIFLRNNPQYNMAKDIAQYRGFSKAYVSKAVEKLLSKGYISVKINPQDRRFQYLNITPKAEPVAKFLKDAQIRFIDTMTQGISLPDTECFNRMLKAFMDNMQKV